MDNFWTQIEVGNTKTYPPVSVRVLWNRKSPDNSRFPFVECLYQYGRGNYLLNGTQLREDDYWAEIPEIL